MAILKGYLFIAFSKEKRYNFMCIIREDKSVFFNVGSEEWFNLERFGIEKTGIEKIDKWFTSSSFKKMIEETRLDVGKSVDYNEVYRRIRRNFLKDRPINRTINIEIDTDKKMEDLKFNNEKVI